jgi:hypothetical protein
VIEFIQKQSKQLIKYSEDKTKKEKKASLLVRGTSFLVRKYNKGDCFFPK